MLDPPLRNEKRKSAPAATPRRPRLTLRDRKKADTWHKLLASAREVFLETGFRQACLEEIAVHAGVAKGTLYRHVESKAELYVAVLAQELRSFDEEMARVIAQGRSAGEKIEALGEWYVASLATPGIPLVHWALDSQHVIGEIPRAAIAQIQEHTRRRLEHLADVIRQGVETGEFVPSDPWLVANLLWNMVDAFVELTKSPARRELMDRPLDHAFREGLRFILRGLRAR
jgi:AcrR family transcriptional regulator